MAWTDRYCSPAGGGAHDGTSEANAWDLAEAIAAAVGGHRINCIAGTYANTTTSRTWSTGGGAGSTTAPKWWRGYKTAIGDQDARPTAARTAGTDFPLITFTSGVPRINDPHNWFSNFEFRGTAPGTHFMGGTGSKVKFLRCRFDCQEASASSYTVRWSADGGQFSECWFKGTSSVTHVMILEERQTVDGCSFHGGGNGLMLDASASPKMALNCIFDDNGDDGIEVTGHAAQKVVISGCTFYSPGGHGINVTTAIPVLLLVRNNLFHTITTASKYGLSLPSGSAVPLLQGNAYYNVTDRYNNLTEDAEWNAITETVEPLEDPANDDFTPKSTALLIGAGSPGRYENLG